MTALRTLLLLTLWIAGCAEDPDYNPLFDGPSTLSVLYPAANSGWDQPIGFVGNKRSGKIIPLDLKHESALSDQVVAPFIRPRGIATGAGRMLGEIDAYEPSPGLISINAIDHRFNALLSVPYIHQHDRDSVIGPEVVTPTHSPVSFVDADSTGNSAEITGLQLRAGATTTEQWKLTFDGAYWQVEGSRSGLMENPVIPEQPYVSDSEELAFTIIGDATTGDQLQFNTFTLLRELKLDGHPLRMLGLSNKWLLVSVASSEQSVSHIALIDRESFAEVDRWEAPEAAELWAMERDSAGSIYVSDAEAARFWKIELSEFSDETSPQFLAAEEHSSLAIIGDISIVEADYSEARAGYQKIFAATATEQRIDVYDLTTQQWQNVNPLTPDRVGLPLRSTVIGISSSFEPIQLQTEALWGSKDEDHVVVASLADGSVVMLEGESGCLATIRGGATMDIASSLSGQSIGFFDVGESSDPSFVSSYESEPVITSGCGGVVKTENWVVRYDGLRGDWEVEATISGKQSRRAQADSRYISDDGAVSFTILSGSLPATDGDSFSFTTSENVLRMTSAINNIGGSENFERPSTPLVFEYLAGPTGGGWDEYRGRSFALVPVTNNNIVLRVRLETWQIETVWN